jgi:hypothetical protein
MAKWHIIPNNMLMWQDWVNGIVGLWVIVVPFLGLTGASLMWTLVVTGVVVAVLAFWSGAQQSTTTGSRV